MVIIEEEDPENPWWIQIEELAEAPLEPLDSDELVFWQKCIKKYLKPLKEDKNHKAKMQSDLIQLRNNSSFGFWFINVLWVIFNYMVQTDTRLNIFIFGVKVQPLGFIFLVVFFTILCLQIVGMFLHRWGTFLSLMAITELRNPLRGNRMNQSKGMTAPEAVAVTKELQKPRSRFESLQLWELKQSNFLFHNISRQIEGAITLISLSKSY